MGIIDQIIFAKIFKTTRQSKCCFDKRETIVAYDHTGYARWECECGHITSWEFI